MPDQRVQVSSVSSKLFAREVYRAGGQKGWWQQWKLIDGMRIVIRSTDGERKKGHKKVRMKEQSKLEVLREREKVIDTIGLGKVEKRIGIYGVEAAVICVS